VTVFSRVAAASLEFFRSQKIKAPSGAVCFDVAPDGAKISFGQIFYKYAAPTALEVLVVPI
jgi:hypothetical protein